MRGLTNRVIGIFLPLPAITWPRRRGDWQTIYLHAERAGPGNSSTVGHPWLCGCEGAQHSFFARQLRVGARVLPHYSSCLNADTRLVNAPKDSSIRRGAPGPRLVYFFIRDSGQGDPFVSRVFPLSAVASRARWSGRVYDGLETIPRTDACGSNAHA